MIKTISFSFVVAVASLLFALCSQSAFALGDPIPPRPTEEAPALLEEPVTETPTVDAAPEAEVEQEEPSSVYTPPVQPEVSEEGDWYKVRVGIYSKRDAAVNMMYKLQGEGYSAFLVNQAGLWRVQVGAFRNRLGAEEVAGGLKAKGYVTDILVTD